MISNPASIEDTAISRALTSIRFPGRALATLWLVLSCF